MSLNLEGYANRDSIKYIKLYGLHDAKTCIRGTLRYRGFCEIVRGLIELGFWRKEQVNIPGKEAASVQEILASLLESHPTENTHKIDESKAALRRMG